ncbi:chymotrypsin/elastase isoinhibitors 2 to 5 isoform X1 [Cotesia glomerata]|nr:chymotrypsin/elastase isoinhibitors 2 to 5 isoform X1 [Cotesia glomerata]
MSRFLLASIFLIASMSIIEICARKRTCDKKCAAHEMCNLCGNHCEVKCSEWPVKPCLRICAPPTCVCKKGLYRDDHTEKCVPHNKCSVHSKN